jgi:hypothetical protein
MKRRTLVFGLFTLSLLLVGLVLPAQANSATITLLNPPTDGVLHLGIDESYTFDVAIDGDTEFTQAIVLVDQYFPGRGVRSQGAKTVVRQTSTVLHVTLTGVSATARDANGVYPVTLVVGVRYGGGQVVQQAFPITVVVS